MSDIQEPMAIVRWKLRYPSFPDVEIVGSHEMRTISEARDLAEEMNSQYGAGTHWIEPLNHTYEERKDVK
jgi:hypothetical protein